MSAERDTSEESTELQAAQTGPPEPFALRFAWLIVLTAAVVSICLVVIQLGWDWPFGPTRMTTNSEVLNSVDEVVELSDVQDNSGGAREALFRTIAGIAALTAGMLAWGRLEQSRRQHALDRQAAARAVEAQRLATQAQELATRAQAATERGQITDRFTKAVEQLGHADSSVRLGALYALEALAHDSPGERGAIAQVVCAYARHHSIRRDAAGQPVTTAGGSDGTPVPAKVDGRAVDYLAAIRIALRFPADWSIPPRDLRNTVVVELNVWALGLAEQRIGAVNLGGATFIGDVRLDGVAFTDDASFSQAIFTDKAWFDGVTFTRAWFGGVTFSDALLACRRTTLLAQIDAYRDLSTHLAHHDVPAASLQRRIVECRHVRRAPRGFGRRRRDRHERCRQATRPVTITCARPTSSTSRTTRRRRSGRPGSMSLARRRRWAASSPSTASPGRSPSPSSSSIAPAIRRLDR